MSGPNNELCCYCYYLSLAYLAKSNESRLSLIDKATKCEGYVGFCHRYPPKDKDEDNSNPAVEDDDWCGEFKIHPEFIKDTPSNK
jgi:hypothetical protein